jgi:hypothetical protein
LLLQQLTIREAHYSYLIGCKDGDDDGDEWDGRELSFLLKRESEHAFMWYLNKKRQDLLGSTFHTMLLTMPRHRE